MEDNCEQKNRHKINKLCLHYMHLNAPDFNFFFLLFLLYVPRKKGGPKDQKYRHILVLHMYKKCNSTKFPCLHISLPQ